MARDVPQDVEIILDAIRRLARKEGVRIAEVSALLNNSIEVPRIMVLLREQEQLGKVTADGRSSAPLPRRLLWSQA